MLLLSGLRRADGMKYVGIIGKLASHLRIRKCPYCHSSDVRRSHRKNLVEVALSFWVFIPFAARVVTPGSESYTADVQFDSIPATAMAVSTIKLTGH
jgi:hypothetical protein